MKHYFDNLDIGDFFEYYGELYIKTSEIDYYTEYEINAFCITDKTPMNFSKDDEVISVEAEINIVKK
jgi:hypothetical protein